MKKLQKIVASFTLLTVLLFGSTFANAGIIVAGLNDSDVDSEPCTEKVEVKLDHGIIVAGFTGIIVAGFTGIIVAGAVDTNVDCGIIVAG